MSISSDPAALTNQLPISVEFPEDKQKFLEIMSLTYKRIANTVNTKTGGLYSRVESYSSDQYYTDTNFVFRNAYRKTFDIINDLNAGAPIAPGATVTAAHGIVGIVQVVKWTGGIVTDVVDFRPIPFVSATLITDQVQVTVTAVNIIIVNGATAPTITAGTLAIECVKV
jgi:hypothetical protein